MQTIDYASLVKAVKPHVQISDDANKLANALIIDLNIQDKLAVFIAPVTLENHKALRQVQCYYR